MTKEERTKKQFTRIAEGFLNTTNGHHGALYRMKRFGGIVRFIQVAQIGEIRAMAVATLKAQQDYDDKMSRL